METAGASPSKKQKFSETPREVVIELMKKFESQKGVVLTKKEKDLIIKLGVPYTSFSKFIDHFRGLRESKDIEEMLRVGGIDFTFKKKGEAVEETGEEENVPMGGSLLQRTPVTVADTDTVKGRNVARNLFGRNDSEKELGDAHNDDNQGGGEHGSVSDQVIESVQEPPSQAKANRESSMNGNMEITYAFECLNEYEDGLKEGVTFAQYYSLLGIRINEIMVKNIRSSLHAIVKKDYEREAVQAAIHCCINGPVGINKDTVFKGEPEYKGTIRNLLAKGTTGSGWREFCGYVAQRIKEVCNKDLLEETQTFIRHKDLWPLYEKRV